MIILAAGVLCSLAGCREAGLSQPDFPLAEAVIATALDETGLPGTISEEDTRLLPDEGYSSYTLRAEDQPLPLAFISSSLREGKRFLTIHYMSPSVPEAPDFLWEDWKQQLVFAALLYGGFADEEELYRAFSAQEVSDGKLPSYGEGELAQIIVERYEWTAELPAGYCMVHYELFNSRIEQDIFGSGEAEVVTQSPRMTVTIYEEDN